MVSLSLLSWQYVYRSFACTYVSGARRCILGCALRLGLSRHLHGFQQDTRAVVMIRGMCNVRGIAGLHDDGCLLEESKIYILATDPRKSSYVNEHRVLAVPRLATTGSTRARGIVGQLLVADVQTQIAYGLEGKRSGSMTVVFGSNIPWLPRSGVRLRCESGTDCGRPCIASSPFALPSSDSAL